MRPGGLGMGRSVGEGVQAKRGQIEAGRGGGDRERRVGARRFGRPAKGARAKVEGKEMETASEALLVQFARKIGGRAAERAAHVGEQGAGRGGDGAGTKGDKDGALVAATHVERGSHENSNLVVMVV